MTKKQPKSASDEEKFLWFMLAAYLADAMNLFDPTAAAKLANLEPLAGAATWQDRVRNSFDIDDAFVRGVYALCRERNKDEAQSIAFIMNGLGCPNTEETLRDLSGILRG